MTSRQAKRMAATSVLSSMSTLSCFVSQRPKPSGFCHFYACSSSTSHAQFSAGFNHTVLKQRRAGKYRNFAIDIRKDVSGTESPSEMMIEQTISGEVILQELPAIDIAILVDKVSDISGKRVSLQLVSSDQVDPGISVSVLNQWIGT